MHLAALSIDGLLERDLLRVPCRGLVHSVFERVVNVATGRDQLLTLAHRGADDAPDSVVVDLAAWSGSGLAPGAPVQMDRAQIVIDDCLCIDLLPARPWFGALPAYPDDDSILARNLAFASGLLARHGRGAAAALACTSPSRLDRALAAVLRRETRALCEAIAEGDLPRALEHVGRLIGLGHGLTPSGDDFLVGLLAVLNLAGGPCHAWRSLGERIVEIADRQTHLISATALRQAARGRVRQRLIDLCDALQRAGRASVGLTLGLVLEIGSSSGSDLAAGVLAGFELQLGARVAA